MDASANLLASPRRWQFGLRTLLIATTGLALFCGALTGAFGPEAQTLALVVGILVVDVVALAIFALLYVLATAFVLAPIWGCLLVLRYYLSERKGRGEEA